MSPPPIFVVGVPRSGTTLLASILSAHSRLAGGPETAFFASLAATDEAFESPAGWPSNAIRFAESARLEDESLLERFEVDPDQLRDLLAEREKVAASVLEVLGERIAAQAGKARWVEKSPIHLLYVREIRHWFPLAHIVRIVRDPRDVAMSLARVPWGPGDLVGGLLYWRRFHERSRSFFDSDPLSYTVRYEELVASTEETVRHVCSFIGEAPEPGMLAESRPTDRLVRQSESWKGNVGGAIDRSRTGKWCELPELDQRLADAVAGDLLRELDYPLAGAPSEKGWVWLHPRTEAAADDAELRDHLDQGRRLWPLEAAETPRAGLLIGDPDVDDWLGRRSWERLRALLSIVSRTARLRLQGKRVSWNRRRAASEGRGLSSGLLSVLLKPLTGQGGGEG